MLIEVNYSTGARSRSVTVVPSVNMTVSGVYPFSVKFFFFLSSCVSTKKEFFSLFLSIHPVLIEESNSTGSRHFLSLTVFFVVYLKYVLQYLRHDQVSHVLS